MAQTAAAFPVARCKLMQRRVDFAAAVTDAVPDGRPGSVSLRQRVLRGQTPEALTGDISLPRLDMCIASAVRDGSALQSACVEQNFSSAVAAAAPNGVAIFVLGRCFFHAQMTDTIADGNFCARCLCGHIDCPIEHNFSYIVNGHGRMREDERPNAALKRKPCPNGRKKTGQ